MILPTMPRHQTGTIGFVSAEVRTVFSVNIQTSVSHTTCGTKCAQQISPLELYYGTRINSFVEFLCEKIPIKTFELGRYTHPPPPQSCLL